MYRDPKSVAPTAPVVPARPKLFDLHNRYVQGAVVLSALLSVPALWKTSLYLCRGTDSVALEWGCWCLTTLAGVGFALVRSDRVQAWRRRRVEKRALRFRKEVLAKETRS